MTAFRSLRYVGIAVLATALAGCKGSIMVRQDLPMDAKPDQALVVFMRSSFLGSAYSASVYDITGPGETFIGVLPNGTKLAYYVNPGEHTFMVISEAGDFMKAKVMAGKTYYALVYPRMGVLRARFSFRPVRASELGGGEFAAWDSDTYFVTNSPKSLAYAQRVARSISAKRASWWPDWEGKPADERASQTLNSEDGR